MADDGGVLENLPNSRPGRRSEKRQKADRPAKSASAAAAKAEAAGKRAAATPKTKPKPKAAAKAKAAAKPKADAPKASAAAPEPQADPVTTVIRTAAGVATAGLRVAHAVTRELLRRIPRP
jgi:hypothetical protein